MRDLLHAAAAVDGEVRYRVIERPELDRFGYNPEAALAIDSADAHMRLACAELDRHAGETLSVRARVKARAHVSAATGLARDAVDVLYYASGASAILSHVPIQRFQRDMQALANHAVMHPQTTTELYGRVLCGLEPNSPLY